METFFKDKSKVFECKVLIDGADKSDTSVRLILNFDDSDTNMLYYGSINEDNLCSINVPALKETKGSKGKVRLEVIAESTLFTPWEDDFETKQSKSVVVERVEAQKPAIIESKSVTVAVDRPKKEEPKQEPEVRQPVKLEPKPAGAEAKKPMTKQTFKENLLKVFNKVIVENKFKDEDVKYHLPSRTALQVTDVVMKSLKKEDVKAFQYFVDNLKEDTIKKVKTFLLN